MITVGPTINPKWVLVAVILAFIVLALGADRVAEWWNTRQAVASAMQPVKEKVEATAAINEDAAAADAARETSDSIASTAANTFRNDIARSHRDDPTARDRAARPVPVSVRNAFRARRLAIERSGCVGAECGTPAPEPDAAER